jgi:riboflavin synthase
MFTGIIEEIGFIQQITSSNVKVKCKKVLENVKLGDSIALNGVCLTVTQIYENAFMADISPETFKVTTLKILKQSNLVNLERAIQIGERFGGHIVYGHIDGIGKCSTLTKNNDFYELKISIPTEIERYVVKKGSISIDGISLTIAEVKDKTIKIAIIPHTFENTNLKTLQVGSLVNIETDIFARYIEKFLFARDNRTRVTLDFLKENGF